MCGINGICNIESSAPIDKELLKKMRDTMVHRGPDFADMWISNDRQVGLAHRRLAIIDISEFAKQPMCNEDKSLWIVFNGEIYNHGELRPELQRRGHKFITDHNDTEVIIHAFEEWGKDCVCKFRGMFAFAIWDEQKKELWLFRDHVGIKPLYYTIQNGKFIFSSEIKAILANSQIQRVIDEEAFYHYLSFGMTPCPFTLFKGINKLSPGCYCNVRKNGCIEITRYWDVLDHIRPLNGMTEDEIAETVLAELRTAVNYWKVSDVPVGVFLSGGIDSSTITALFSVGEKNIRTFSIGAYSEDKIHNNEFEYARMMAHRVGAHNFSKALSVEDFIQLLPTLIYHQDEPNTDYSSIPTLVVSMMARAKGVNVCLTGEGSDELFFGYSRWKSFLRFQKLMDVPMTAGLKKTGLVLLKKIKQDHRRTYEWLRRFMYGEPIFWGRAGEWFTEGEKQHLLSDRLKKQFQLYSSFEVIRDISDRFNDKTYDTSLLNWMSYMELSLRLPEIILMRVDKMAMANSLEARVPFLDYKFVEFVMSIPTELRLKNGILKYLLKKSVRGIVPDEIIDRKKQGFAVPLYGWFDGALGSFAKKKIFDFTKKTDFFSEDFLERLFKKNSVKKLWHILNFVLWYEYWIEKKYDQ